MSYVLSGLNVIFAAINLWAGVSQLLQPEYSPDRVAFSFAVALLCSLTSLILAPRN